ncbi:sensor domain-containing diguanylate cyclase [Acinetobacter indicus]|uniref:sensor domain-containing diguanylate cyclase n=1 Tax=Acinetobacter indicus TaxID=756892 RepID=UPI002578590E|nr:sensor domain-containing diguanylate cyclase [Acinetobacter indicus]MDM1261423.1 sensor domain-containing diguanylate cyclase [Acinetobacter indicus]
MSEINSALKEDQFYKTLLETTNAIPWQINWKTKAFSYIGPQIEPLLGWTQDSWKTAQDWIDRMHPEDRDKTVNMCMSLSDQGTDHEADYRALTATGDYVWIRDVVHVIRENDETVAIIGFMFDISARKQMELELEALSRKNLALSLQDPLTLVANRKALSECIENEFKRASRHQHALSMLFIDIDHFKPYNDNYGHLQGDHCLISVAQLLKQHFARASDFVARFGGEEFVVLLPETPLADAVQLAENFRQAVYALEIPHTKTGEITQVTVSIGANSYHQNQQYHNVVDFLHSADELLYLAKNKGRNQVQYLTQSSV